MTDLAPILQGFFTDRLARQKKASPNTVAAYRDTCKLLLTFAQEQTGKPPTRLSVADLDATLVELGSRGLVPIRTEVVGDGGRKATLLDPDGNSVAVMQVHT